jgi:hypothetical protein
MPRTTVKVEHANDRLSLHFQGAHLAKANAQLLTECFNALFECAEKNGCFEKGLSAICLSTIAEHDRKSRCISSAFGFTAATQR